MAAYQIFTDATADLSDSFMEGLPQVKIVPMQVEIGGSEYTYGPNGDISVQEFYRLQRSGNFAQTSQISPAEYLKCFEPCLCQGTDILYLCFSSGMSGTLQSARLCIEELKQEYPERNIICIDTLCASAGEGFLVREAAEMQAQGLTIEALADWVWSTACMFAIGLRWTRSTISGTAGAYPLPPPLLGPYCRSNRCSMWMSRAVYR